jgi:hypothetical protein
LCNRPVLVSKLAPTYAQSHEIDIDEGVERVDRALERDAKLRDELLGACWDELQAKRRSFDEAALLEKIAQLLKDRPQRPGKVAAMTPGWSAFLVLIDLDAGLASDSARRILESDEGKKRLADGVAEVGRFLAAELLRA